MSIRHICCGTVSSNSVVCPFVYPHETSQESLNEFSRNLLLENFTKIFRHILILVEIGRQ